MLKLLILMLFPLLAHGKDVEPKFFKGQKITYKPGFFLHKVCSGKGTIQDMRELYTGGFAYMILPPVSESDCDIQQFIDEKDIKAAE